MHRIDGADIDPNANGSGKAGFHRGDPVSGREATEITEHFMNAVQEELCNVIEESGIALDKTQNNQISKALKKMLAEALPRWEKIANKPNSLQGYGITDAASKSEISGRVSKSGDTMTGHLNVPSIHAIHQSRSTAIMADTVFHLGTNTSPDDWHLVRDNGFHLYQGKYGYGLRRLAIDKEGRVTMPAQPHWQGGFTKVTVNQEAVIHVESSLGSGWVINNAGVGGGTRVYPPASGWYEVSFSVIKDPRSPQGQCQLHLLKNNIPVGIGVVATAPDHYASSTSIPLLLFLTTSDFISLRCMIGTSHGDSNYNKLSIKLVK